MSTWTVQINSGTPVSPESLGITLVDLSLVSHGAGRLALEIAQNFDAAVPVSFGDTVKLLRTDGETTVTVFAGKSRTVPTWGMPADEGIRISVEDFWHDLDATIYEEDWNGYDPDDGSATTYAIAKAVLGVDMEGNARTTAEALEDVITAAAAAGVDVQLGTVPTGMNMVNREVTNASCGELIKDVLAYHANWMTSVDYTTTPPTLNITERATAAAHDYPLDGSGQVTDFQLTRRDDLRPLRVILKMEAAGGFSVGGAANNVGRSIVADMWPAASGPPDPIPTAGPRVIIATVANPLVQNSGGSNEGTPAQIETIGARIQTQTIPTTAGAAAKAYLEKKFPQLAGLDFTVAGWDRFLMDPGTQPDPINPESAPPAAATVDDLPRELLGGQLTDWMQVKSGRVSIQWGATIGTVTAAERKLIRGVPKQFSITGTDGITKLYTKVTSYTPGSPPSGSTPLQQFAARYGADADAEGKGLARRYFEMLDQDTYEGRLVIEGDEIPATLPLGGVINLTAGVAGWATMRALCTGVAVDLQTSRTSIDFGPPRWVSFGDFIDQAKALRDGRGRYVGTSSRTSSNAGGWSFEPDEKETDDGYLTANTEPGGAPIPDPTVTGAGQIEVTEDADTETFTVRGNSREHDVFVWRADQTKPSTGNLQIRDGLETAGSVSPASAAERSVLDIRLPHIQATSPSQLSVSEAGGIYEIRGNSTDGNLTVNGGSAILEWADGLLTTAGNVNITVSADLPSGSAGDVLYHNGTNWIALAAPAAPTGSNLVLLRHNGTAPSWVELVAESLSICGGTITVYKAGA